MKRIMLFIGTNLAVVLVLGIVLNVIFSMLGINYSHNNISAMLVLALVFGFGGSFISLFISKWMAKRSTGAQVITNPTTSREHWLLQTVEKLAIKSGIGVPEVAIYPGREVNAFATGANKNNALVAVSIGLLDTMEDNEIEAVLAHEVSHIANGDMVTMALLQGILNTFVIFFARLVAMAIEKFMSSSEDGGGLGTFAYFGVVMALELIFGMLASIVVMAFSRRREFKADAGSAHLVGAHNMSAALLRLKSIKEEPQELEGQLAAFGLRGKKSLSEYFTSHPPLEKRIEALNNL